jgi:hypothetical protein
MLFTVVSRGYSDRAPAPGVDFGDGLSVLETLLSSAAVVDEMSSKNGK